MNINPSLLIDAYTEISDTKIEDVKDRTKDQEFDTFKKKLNRLSLVMNQQDNIIRELKMKCQNISLYNDSNSI